MREARGVRVQRAPGLATHTHRYRVLPDGAILVENVVELDDGVRDVPRVGVVLVLRPGLERLEWFGPGAVGGLLRPPRVGARRRATAAP